MTRGDTRPTVLSLFSGGGGLDVGLEAAGFETRLCVEVDEDARSTLSKNRPQWKLASPGDVHKHRADDLLALANLDEGELDLLAAGPPCQPFSKSGYWSAGDSKRLDDPRSATLRAYLHVVEAALPRVVLLENVRGLTFNRKDEGVRFLEKGFQRINRRRNSSYHVSVVHLNAAEYGIPQFRERVFVIATHSGVPFREPRVTHGGNSTLQPFHTAWDAIGDLDTDTWEDELEPTGKWAGLLRSIPEGQNYLWHTQRGGGEPLFGWRTRYWSFLLKLAKDRPSWTIQAEPGPATGPFHWKSRLLSVRELCRLQTFPDDYVIEGDRRSAQRQVGNAVPCALAELIGLQIRRQLFDSPNVRRDLRLLTKRSKAPPRAQRSAKVPKEYFGLRARHRAHPGTGKGPGARRRKLEKNK